VAFKWEGYSKPEPEKANDLPQVQFPGIISNIRTMADGSLRLVVDLQEIEQLNPALIALLFSLLNKKISVKLEN